VIHSSLSGARCKYTKHTSPKQITSTDSMAPHQTLHSDPTYQPGRLHRPPVSLPEPVFCLSLRAGSLRCKTRLLPLQDSTPRFLLPHGPTVSHRVTAHGAPLSPPRPRAPAIPTRSTFESPTLQPRCTPPKILDSLRRRPPTRRVGEERGEMDFAGMKRWDLQALCKQHGLPGGGTNAALVARLAACSALQVMHTRPA
jgi:hypothetical protein